MTTARDFPWVRRASDALPAPAARVALGENPGVRTVLGSAWGELARQSHTTLKTLKDSSPQVRDGSGGRAGQSHPMDDF